MRKIVILLLLFGSVGLRISNSPVHAYVGWMPGAGGVLTSDNQNDTISMDSENVLVQIKSNSNLFPDRDGKYEGYYAHVEASFVMKNNSDDNITEQVFFPFYTNSSMDGDPNKATWLKNISILVNEQSKEYTLSNLKFDNEALASAVFQVEFKEKSQNTIEVIYDLQLNNRPHQATFGFDYMMKTGATWNGTIGSGEITIDLSDFEITHKESVSINDFFTVENGNLVWKFNNLEPDDSYNIKLSFDPTDITAWNQYPENISSTTYAYTFDNRLFALNVNTNPDRRGWPEDYVVVKSSPGYLIDESQEFHGWMYNNSADARKVYPDRYLQFNFDGKYIISELKVQTGIKVVKESNTLYNVLERPKTLRITFSDNSYQDVQLEDTPSVFQTVSDVLYHSEPLFLLSF